MRRLLFALAIVCAAASAARATSSWDIDPAHTSAQFAVKHLMVSTVRGTLGAVTGTAVFDEADISKSSVQATIDVAGIDTREAKRDAHLKSPEFLDAAKFPTITFKSKKVESVGADKFKITGDLTIRGVTKEVTLDVEGTPKPLNDPFGKVRMGGSAHTRINRQDFGVNFSKTMDNGGLVVGNDVDVTIDIEIVKKAQ